MLSSSPVYIWSKYLLNAWSLLNNNTEICHAPHSKHQKFYERAGTISSVKIMIFANRKTTIFSPFWPLHDAFVKEERPDFSF